MPPLDALGESCLGVLVARKSAAMLCDSAAAEPRLVGETMGRDGENCTERGRVRVGG